MDQSSSTPFHGSLKRYWRRRKYQRLTDQADGQNKRASTGSGGGRIRRLRWRPLKLIGRLRNGYVKMMLRLAGNVGSLNTNKVFGGKRIPKGRQTAVVYSHHEVESRLVYEIYLALKANRDLPVAISSDPVREYHD